MYTTMYETADTIVYYTFVPVSRRPFKVRLVRIERVFDDGHEEIQDYDPAIHDNTGHYMSKPYPAEKCEDCDGSKVICIKFSPDEWVYACAS